MPNEATNFREAVAENFRDVFLGQDHGEETASYVPDRGTLREITVRVVESLVVWRDATHHRVKEHVLRLIVEKDATRGIDDPRQDDVLYRGVEPDLGDAFDFVEVEADDTVGNFYRLKFARELITDAGPQIGSPL